MPAYRYSVTLCQHKKARPGILLHIPGRDKIQNSDSRGTTRIEILLNYLRSPLLHVTCADGYAYLKSV